MAELLSIPMKKTSEVDIVKPLKTLFATRYSTADQPQEYSDAISKLQKLRNAATNNLDRSDDTNNPDRSDESLDAMLVYYDNLVALEVKIFASDVQIPFKWTDAFDEGSSLAGVTCLTISSIEYEKVGLNLGMEIKLFKSFPSKILYLSL